LRWLCCRRQIVHGPNLCPPKEGPDCKEPGVANSLRSMPLASAGPCGQRLPSGGLTGDRAYDGHVRRAPVLFA
jgi:hypothetical protein